MADGDILQIVAGHQEFVSALAGNLRLRKVNLDHDDFTFDAGPGAYVSPTIYTLQPGDWLFMSQLLVTTAFDDTGIAVSAYLTPVANDFQISKLSALLPAPTWDGPAVGLVNADQGTNAEVYVGLDPKLPITPTPGGAAVPLRIQLIDFVGDGTTGTLQVLLWVAEF